MKPILFLLFFFFLRCQTLNGQPVSIINKVKFFEDTSVLNATIKVNMVNLFREINKQGMRFPANFSATLPDNTQGNEPIFLEVRGHFRRAHCYLPPLKIIFGGEKNFADKSLSSLKLVNQCTTANTDEQYLLKEYVVYKIYNLLTDMSFRVRLLHLNLADSSGRKKPIYEYGFIVEDIKNVAKRNNCKEWKNEKIDPRQTDPQQMTIVAIFEYMIGNTDWGVSANHNTRLLRSKTDSLQKPYVVPYDFDFSGFVNTDYSIPDEKLDIKNVRERLYRGFPKSMDEVNKAVDIFKKQKSNIYALINNFDLLTPNSKKELSKYLDDFFVMINKTEEVKKVFIDNARTE